MTYLSRELDTTRCMSAILHRGDENIQWLTFLTANFGHEIASLNVHFVRGGIYFASGERI